MPNSSAGQTCAVWLTAASTSAIGCSTRKARSKHDCACARHGTVLGLADIRWRSSQAAAEEVAREHPDGIDFLIVNAGIVNSQHKNAINTCDLLHA